MKRVPVNNVEPKMNFLTNVLHQGRRYRVFGNRVYYRPPKETFAEFLEYFVRNLFSEKWWKAESKKPRERQHIVYRWERSTQAAKILGCLDQRQESDGSVSFNPSGPISSWLSFGYDLLCLFHKQKLSAKFIERLKEFDQFQGAWFELAVTATILRAGCDIDWIDDKTKKNCEFIATHKATNTRFGVEAKSKRRSGTLNHPLSENPSSASCMKLVNAGLQQAPEGMPFVLFVDVNRPFVPGKDPLKKPIGDETVKIAECLPEADAENHDKFSLLITTSFPFHYGDMETVAPPVESGEIIPQYCQYPLPDLVYSDIIANVKKYGLIPEEI